MAIVTSSSPKWNDYVQDSEWLKNIPIVKRNQLKLFIELQLYAMMPPKTFDEKSWIFLSHKTQVNHILVVLITDEPSEYANNLNELLHDAKNSLNETAESEQEIPFSFTEKEGVENMDINPLPNYDPKEWKDHKYYAWFEIIVDFDKDFKKSQMEEIQELQTKIRTSLKAHPSFHL